LSQLPAGRQMVHEMRIDFIDRNRIGITLSRSNLCGLLAKLDGHPPSSACMIAKDTDIGFLTVHAEEDATHYDASRGLGMRGQMHPETEAAIAEKRGSA
jgi:hypothetical protein